MIRLTFIFLSYFKLIIKGLKIKILEQMRILKVNSNSFHEYQIRFEKDFIIKIKFCNIK